MPVGQLTVTAKTGPAYQNTANVLVNVDRLDFDLGDSRLQVYQLGAGNVKEFDLASVTIVTITISAGVYTVVVS